MNNKLTCNLFYFLVLIQFAVSAQSVMEYEIIPFDYTDEDMREQLCDMVDQDIQIQNMTHETAKSMRAMLLQPDLKHKLQCMVCRTTDDAKTVCGFMIYFFSHTAYFVGDVQRMAILFNETYVDEFEGTQLTQVPDVIDFGFIDDIAVHKNFRGQGIAQAMLEYFEQDCRNRGISTLLLGVEVDNHQARRAYHKFGFFVHQVYVEQIMMKQLD